jgi:hypothetical protein
LTTSPPDLVPPTQPSAAHTPPPGASSPASTPTPPPAGRRGSARIISILAICAGAVLIAGTIFSGVLVAVRTSATHSQTLTAAATGIAAVDIEASAAEVTLTYGAVDEATLRVTGSGGADGWRFERDGDRLVVAASRDWWSRWGWLRGADTVELTLPASVRGADADVDVSGGSFVARGDFGALGLTLDAGSLRIDGTADALITDVNAGSARVDLAGVGEATVTVNAGSFDGALTGAAPDRIGIEVNAGRMDLTVPDTTYAITSEVAAGRFTHDLTADPGARNRIDVHVSAGAVTLTPGS